MPQSKIKHVLRAIFLPDIKNPDPVKQWKLNTCYKTLVFGVTPLLVPLIGIFAAYDIPEMFFGALYIIPVVIASVILIRKGKLGFGVNLAIIGITVTNILYVFHLHDDSALYLMVFMIIIAGIFLGKKAAFIWAIIQTGITIIFRLMIPSFTDLSFAIQAKSASARIQENLLPIIIVYFAASFLSILFQSYFNNLLDKIRRHHDETLMLESELFQAQKMECIAMLASGIAHDFNHSLTTIKTCANLIVKKAGADQDIARYGKSIYETCNIIHNSTGKLLSFSRNSTIEMTPINFHEVMESMVSLLEYLLPENITIKTELKAQRHFVTANFSQMQNVLMNLAINASDAMPGGGELKFATSNTPAYSGPASNSEEKEIREATYLDVQVTDNGAGMDAQTIAKIFTPFFTTKGVKGSGLGLTVVKRILDAHKARISVSSEVGKGTVITLQFPLITIARAMSGKSSAGN
jgi:signal transduction histidine kinase